MEFFTHAGAGILLRLPGLIKAKRGFFDGSTA
jgi:hypothetical protein